MKNLKTILFILIVKSACFSQNIEYDRTIKQYFVAEFTPLESDISFSVRAQIQREHMQYIQVLAQDNKLVLAGPFLKGGGLFILNTSSKEEASEWMEADPTIKSKLNDFNLRNWLTEKGLFTLENTPDSVSENDEPNLKIAKETWDYSEFVGDWEIVASFLNDEGEWAAHEAIWKFKNVLEGLVIRSYWVHDGNKTLREWGDLFDSNIIHLVHGSTRDTQKVTDREKRKTVWVNNTKEDGELWNSFTNQKKQILIHDVGKKWEITFFNLSVNQFDLRYDVILDDGTKLTKVKLKAQRK